MSIGTIIQNDDKHNSLSFTMHILFVKDKKYQKGQKHVFVFKFML